MTIMQTILAALNWEVRVTENFRSVSPAAMYGLDPTSSGLTLKLLGGIFNTTSVADYSSALTASSGANYVVASRTTGAITRATNTTDWNDTTNYLRIGIATAGASTFSWDDQRAGPYGAAGGGGGGTPGGSTTQVQYNNAGAFAGSASFTWDNANSRVNTANLTATGLVLTAASASGGAGFRLPHGAAPTSPTNGDVWTTTTGLFARINGTTVGPYAVAGGSPAWGSITGTLSSQADLQAALDLKQNRTPSVQSVTSSGTVTPTFSNDAVKITAQAAALTLANPTGTAIDMAGMVIRIKDDGTARAITYGSQYRAMGVTLPTTTVVSKTLYLAMIYNSDDTKWDVVAVGQEA